MNIFKRTWEKLNNYLKKENYFLSTQKTKEMDCIVNGHKWTSNFDPKKEISKPITKRVYCKHCGVYYHEHVYHK